jgi:hypothetical protein
VPSSVDWVTVTTRGWAWCSKPKPCASRSISSGVSFPSGVGTASIFTPATFSGAPHSSTCAWAVAVQIAASQRSVIAASATTFAPVPLNRG